MTEKIIFDCDNTMGVAGCDVDDGLALLYLLGKEHIDLCGVTTTYGNSDLNTVYQNTLTMLKEIGKPDIPLLKGCEDKHHYQSEATDFLVESVNSNPGRITILATGSLTNLYAAYRSDPSFLAKVKRIVVMGGTTEPLIINGRPLNELNFSCDSLATETVLKLGNNVSVITGNTCLDAFFPKEAFFARLSSENKPIARYLLKKTSYWFKYMMFLFNLDGFYNWDVVAAAYVANPTLFEDRIFSFNLRLAELEHGELTLEDPPNDSLHYSLNLPRIQIQHELIEDIYNTWLSLDLKFSSPKLYR
ncbi:nucleoside hydrolase [Desulfosporosinus youngiae]|uniref:Inosine-uridine nucleoside N-ribohydrolase n=1 Tax=Desulfosporosinus youngiae DSM 17734 TaxID=768710 RepID=H5XV89_9FIRM|nr:nucleoside hydrolase [Desulfosporosinus youngiae]EHQ89687.1 Inosine-uridine nucleoside N-ribohydrolase [Desulfosporosinus youngiae DSM 17734]